MKNNKTPGNDGLTKELYETFSKLRNLLRTPLMESVNQAFHTKILSISQRQAVIKLIEKNDRDKRYIKNWRPVSLLNVDEKIVSKAISNKLKTALSTLISSQQTAYVINKFIAEKGRLISGITEISGCFNITYFLYSWVLKKLLILLTIVFLFPS